MRGRLKWVVAAATAVILLFIGVFIGTRISWRSDEPIPPAKFDDYASQLKKGRYVNTKYKIIFNYPLSWSMNTTTEVFENGDLVAVEFVGPTQKERTEFYDGARFVVMIPEKTNLDLSSWINSKHQGLPGEKPPVVNDVEVNGRGFKKVDECGLGCFSYYYTLSNGQVYGMMASSAGPQKAELEATLDQILNSVELQ